MNDGEDMIEAENDNDPKKDKHNWGAADLEKVNAFVDDKDDAKGMTSDNLGKLIGGAPTQEARVVNVRKEDIQLLVNELELPQVRVQQLLVEHNGDVRAAIMSFMGA